MAADEELQIIFDGGMASTGRLHFYEYSRSQYATARFVAVLERFRRDQSILQRVSSKNYVDILIETPERGSFIETILIPGAQQVAAVAISTPLNAIISYAWHLLIPRRESTDDLVVRMAEIKLAEEEQRTLQEGERTAQLGELRGIVETQQATTKQALELAHWALHSTNPRLGRADIDQSRALEVREELNVEKTRIEAFEKFEGELEKISPEKIIDLTSRIRPIVREMALPLRRSADTLSFRSSRTGDKFVSIDKNDAANITRREIESEIVELTCHVKAFDRDTGVGKVTMEGVPRPVSFTVPYARRGLLRDRVLEAMRLDTVVFFVRQVVDGGGSLVSYILEDVDLRNPP